MKCFLQNCKKGIYFVARDKEDFKLPSSGLNELTFIFSESVSEARLFQAN